jgi:hypothetical protein
MAERVFMVDEAKSRGGQFVCFETLKKSRKEPSDHFHCLNANSSGKIEAIDGCTFSTSFFFLQEAPAALTTLYSHDHMPIFEAEISREEHEREEEGLSKLISREGSTSIYAT